MTHAFTHAGVLLLHLTGTAPSYSPPRSGVLAQIYDKLCRAEWAEKASRGDIGFNVNEASKHLHVDVLERAKLAYDAGAPKKAKPDSTPAKKPDYGKQQFKRQGHNGPHKRQQASVWAKTQKRWPKKQDWKKW